VASRKSGEDVQVEPLQLVGHLLHELVPAVVSLGVGPHHPHVGVELLRDLVDAGLELELDGLQVDGTADRLVVPRCAVPHLVHWFQDGKYLLVGLQPPQYGAFPVEPAQLLSEALA
jgi:hypothetical protein